MNKFLNTKRGFSLIELLMSVGIMLIFLPIVASILTSSRFLSSYSKHKAQAAYAAQQIIETYRQSAFIQLAAGGKSVIGPNNVLLDPKGNFNNNLNSFFGTSTITVTPAVYTNAAGVKTTNINVDHFSIVINWNEQVIKLLVPMSETYAADIEVEQISNPVLN